MLHVTLLSRQLSYRVYSMPLKEGFQNVYFLLQKEWVGMGREYCEGGRGVASFI